MYTKEQEEMALREYERLGSVAAVIQKLGYPSESTLYRWYERKKAGLENRHGQIEEATATMDHRPTAAPRITYSGGRTEDRSLLYARLYRYRYRAVSNANRFTGSAGSTDSSIHSCWSR